MCGSATLLTEAFNFYQPLKLRPFAFETAPFFKGRLLKLPASSQALPIKEGWGFDLNQDLLQKVEAELKNKYPLHLSCKDSIKEVLNVADQKIILCNPPYGERLKISGKRGSFLKEAWQKFLSVDKPFRFGWVLPSDMDDLFAVPESYILLSKRHLKNGGLPVTYWIWERKP
jgi:23S rRNA G2445 N2-methylase RlmL